MSWTDPEGIRAATSFGRRAGWVAKARGGRGIEAIEGMGLTFWGEGAISSPRYELCGQHCVGGALV